MKDYDDAGNYDAGNYDETKMQRYLEETTARSMAGIKASYPLADLRPPCDLSRV